MRTRWEKILVYHFLEVWIPYKKKGIRSLTIKICIREAFFFHLHTEEFYHLEKNILKLLPRLKHKLRNITFCILEWFVNMGFIIFIVQSWVTTAMNCRKFTSYMNGSCVVGPEQARSLLFLCVVSTLWELSYFDVDIWSLVYYTIKEMVYDWLFVHVIRGRWR